MSLYPIKRGRDAGVVSLSPTNVGIIYILVAMVIFSVQDVIVKQLGSAFPANQILFLRSLFGLPLLMGLMYRKTGRWWFSGEQLGLQVLRAAMAYVSYLAYYLSLSALPLAETTAIFFSSPLIVLLLSVFFLGQRIGRSRLFTILVGFAGVFVIIRPGFAVVDPAVVLPILSACSYAVLVLTTRYIKSSSYDMAGYTILLYLVVALVSMPILSRFSGLSQHPSVEFLTRPWVWPTPAQFGLFVLIAITFLAGFVLITEAYQMADATAVSPFEYFMIPISMVWGMLFFGEWPDLLSYSGIGMIVLSGLLIWRQGEPVQAGGENDGTQPAASTTYPVNLE